MVRLIARLAGAILIAQAAAAQDAPRTDGWVVLPIDDYRALRARAFPDTPDPAPPPVDAALTRVDYELRAGSDTVAVQIPGGLLVRDARLDGRPTALSVLEPGTPARVLIARTGRVTLTLDLVMPMTSAAGAESIVLPASGSALSAVTLIVPRTGVSLTAAGGFIAEQTETGAESRWVVFGSPGRPLSFTWKRKADDRRAELPLRTRARITELVALGEDATIVTAGVQVEVTQGQARQAVVALPPGLVVNQVAGPTVADWEFDRTTLTVTFLDPIATQTSVVITGELRTPRDGSIAIPIVRVPAAERETGGVAVDVSGPGEIASGEPRGLEPADAADLGDVVAGHESPSMVAFRFTPLGGGAARSLSVNVTRYTTKPVLVATIEEARYDALVGEDGKVLVRARYAVRNNRRSFLAVSLPPRALLWSASLSGRPVRPGIGATGGLLLPLQKGRANEDAPAFVVEVMYLQRIDSWADKGGARVELPAVDLPVSRTGLALHHSPRYDVELKAGIFRVSDDRGPWSAALRGEAAPPAGAAATQTGRDEKDLKALIDRLQKEAGRSRTGVVPIAIAFPTIGPSVFLAAELTPEAQTPAFELQYRRTIHADDKGGL
jgi:hypothetical protein